MYRKTAACSLLLALVALSICGSQPKPTKTPTRPPSPPATVEHHSPSTPRQWQAVLEKPVSLNKGIDPMPLKEALESLQDLFNVSLLVDNQSFRIDISEDDVESKQVKLPKMVDVRFRTVLRLLADQLPQATYLVLGDHIEITTLNRARPEYWQGTVNRLGRPVLPLVYAQFENTPLSEALNQLADISDVTIVLDGGVNAGYAAKPVTLCLRNVPADVAARSMALSVGLDAVMIDNVLFVTSSVHAKKLQKEIQERMGGLVGAQA